MSYYKIVAAGQVIDVNCVFLRWQANHGMMLVCEEEDAQFITPRDGSAVWHPAWLHPAPAGAVYDGDIDAEEIDAEEYAALLLQLDSGGVVENPDKNVDNPSDEENAPTAENGENVQMTPTVADVKTILEEQAALKEQVQMLTECVLEMSEEVYA